MRGRKNRYIGARTVWQTRECVNPVPLKHRPDSAKGESPDQRQATVIDSGAEVPCMNSDSFPWGLAWFILTALLVTS